MSTDYTKLTDEVLLELLNKVTAQYNKLLIGYANDQRRILRDQQNSIHKELERRKKNSSPT